MKEKKIKFSKFLASQKRNNITAVFHRLKPSPIYLESKKWKQFKKKPFIDKNLIYILNKLQLILYDNRTDTQELWKIRKRYLRNDKKLNTLLLILTRECNLRCKYCFIPSSFKNNKSWMAPRLVKKSIDLWAKHIARAPTKSKEYTVIFSGGEPLLNLKTFQVALEYIAGLQQKGKLPRNLIKLICTNGTLINPAIARFLKKHQVRVSFSLDGPFQINDACRKNKDGEGSFKLAKRGLEVLRKEKISFGISAVVTPCHLKRLSQIVNFFDEEEIKNVGFNELVGKTLFLLDSKKDLVKYWKQTSKWIVKYYIEARKKGLYESQIRKKMEMFKKQIFNLVHCKAYGEQIVVHPNGHISNCPLSSRYIIKHINNWDNDFWFWNASQLKKWRKRLPLYKEECLKCDAISICGGGCGYHAEEIRGNLLEKDEAFCELTKNVFNFIIWDFYKVKKNIRDF